MFARLLADRPRWIALMLLVLILGTAWTWANRVPGDQASPAPTGWAPRPGFEAPDFGLETLLGQSVALEEMRGQAVILNFWATWCLPCRTEMPALERAWDRLADQGLVILAVNLQESPTGVQTFADQLDLSFPILLDQTGSVFRQYQVQLYPTTFFIDRHGLIQEVVYGGPMAESLLTSKALELLEK